MIDRIIKEEGFSIEIRSSLQKLKEDIPSSPIRFLGDYQAPDTDNWNRHIDRYLKNDWLTVPWFFAETYFYRRILEATQYFIDGESYNQDPFSMEKRRSLRQDWNKIQSVVRTLYSPGAPAEEPVNEFSKYIYTALWGNQADLSMWSSASGLQPITEISNQSKFLLIDDCQSVYSYLSSLPAGPERIDFILDNIGLELLGDLCLADYLLERHPSLKVIFRSKAHPTFVSDAIHSDVILMIENLSSDHFPATSALGIRLQTHLYKERLILTSDDFWTSPLGAWDMPQSLLEELQQSSLVIWKGDANYRRLLGDRHWPYTTPFSDVLSYAPTAFLAIRTLKANVLSGLSEDKTQSLTKIDEDWMINGKWGLIQFQGKDPSHR
ncbi:uncharacterized protein METZ01_LOCUS150945 [marine metagenome]|uniref:Damage-control phosphatase ARMT1-like metal-binding domain-containing protein n=1 Tax=marine metagenome TaxID=408172 RepID=A0A382AA20_9ZZZZ